MHPSIHTYIHTHIHTYLLSYFLTYLLTYLLYYAIYGSPERRGIIGRGDDTVGNPHRARISRFEFFEPILLLNFDKRFTVPCRAIRGSSVSVSSTPPPLKSGPSLSDCRKPKNKKRNKKHTTLHKQASEIRGRRGAAGTPP